MLQRGGCCRRWENIICQLATFFVLQNSLTHGMQRLTGILRVDVHQASTRTVGIPIVLKQRLSSDGLPGSNLRLMDALTVLCQLLSL